MQIMAIILLTSRSAPEKIVPIKDEQNFPQELDTGAWFKFSDETVVPLAGKIKLGVQDDEGMKKVIIRFNHDFASTQVSTSRWVR